MQLAAEFPSAVCKFFLRRTLSVLTDILRQFSLATGIDTQGCTQASSESHLNALRLHLAIVRIRCGLEDAAQPRKHQHVEGILLRAEDIQLFIFIPR